MVREWEKTDLRKNIAERIDNAAALDCKAKLCIASDELL